MHLLPHQLPKKYYLTFSFSRNKKTLFVSKAKGCKNQELSKNQEYLILPRGIKVFFTQFNYPKEYNLLLSNSTF